MPPQSAEHAVVGLLTQCYITPRCGGRNRLLANLPRSHSRYSTSSIRHWRGLPVPHGSCLNLPVRHKSIGQKAFSSTSIRSTQNDSQSNDGQERIAVLGGGITGLAAAHHLVREKPNAKITLIEGSNRLGGWLRSTPVDVGAGTVVFESGPRSLRVNSAPTLATLELITNLGIQDEVIATSYDSPAAQNRFVYYPDHLVRMPGKGQSVYNILWSYLTEPIFKGLGKAFLEYKQDIRPSNLEDESVASFMERRLGGADIGDNIVSAVLHGIYAGDIDQLSARSIMANQWWAEKKYGSISASAVTMLRAGAAELLSKDVDLASKISGNIDKDLEAFLNHASVFTFKKGIQTLVEALEKDLLARPNVEIKLNERIESIDYDGQNENVKISTGNGEPEQSYSNVISTISARNLAKASAPPLPSLASQHSVTVMTVSAFYEDPFLLEEPGFGYLIPRSVPFEQNPECALGVVFDSYSSAGQDTVDGTKLTVMFGGHWWDHLKADQYPTEEEGLNMAKAILKRHLKIDVEPAASLVGIHQNCIPQYTVGHEKRLWQGNSELISAFKGKLRVAGSSYGGVGVNDCVRAARDVVTGLGEPGLGVKTGLEEFGYDRKRVLSNLSKMTRKQ